MRILLDTHLVLWALAEPDRLPSQALSELHANDVYVSAASIWEIAIKVGVGKLSANPTEVLAAIAPAGFTLLPISGIHAATVADLPNIHRDPFDRLLVAQALAEPMKLLTNDSVLPAYGRFVSLV
ncbi:MAG: type II toxin-antitoxin system VapC family toxin [Pseudomonadales bacterium]